LVPWLSHLEGIAVQEATERQYRDVLLMLVTWATFHRISWGTNGELDVALVTMFDQMFFHGRSVEDASKLVSALKHAIPSLRRDGEALLPRASRAIAAWRKAAPTQQGLPLPWLALVAMMGFAVFHHGAVGRAIALKWWTMFHTYVRPGEADNLLAAQVVEPAASSGPGAYQLFGLLLHPLEGQRPGKTGLHDEAVLIDCPGLGELLANHARCRGKANSLWEHTVALELNMFNEAVAYLGLAALRPCRYALRHGGASHDLMSRQRSVEETKRRGRWRSDASLRRYAKETRALAELSKMPAPTRQYGELLAPMLVSVLNGARPCPQPPRS